MSSFYSLLNVWRETWASFLYESYANSNKDNKLSKSSVDSTIVILMIDDSQTYLRNMKDLLRNTQYTLIQAQGGTKSLQYLKDNPEAIDLIILDLLMPDMCGLEVLKNIRKLSCSGEHLSQVPIIMQTGIYTVEEIEAIYSLNICGCIRKPYEKENVLAEIRKGVSGIKQAKKLKI